MSDPCQTNDCIDPAVANRWGCLKMLVPLLAALLLLPFWRGAAPTAASVPPPTPYPEYEVAEAQIQPTVIVERVVEADTAVGQLSGNGVPTPVDDDNDGVNDAYDACLGSASGATVDSTGCEPEAEPTAVPEPTAEPTAVPPTPAPAPVATCPLILGQNTDENSQPLPGFFGTGNTGTRLEILEDGVVIGHATVQADGTWRCGCQLSPGNHTLAIREEGGAECAEEQITINILSKAPAYVAPVVNITRDPNAPAFTCPAGSPAGQIEGTLYRVGCGESMGEIASIVGTSFGELLAFNPQVPNASAIYTGQLLNIPLNASCFDEVAN